MTKTCPEVQEWYYRMMNGPEYFERWRFKDTINDYNSIIKEFENYMSKHLQQIDMHVLES